MNVNKKLYSWIALIAAVIMWGLSFLSIKVTIAVIPTMTQALLRFLIASVALYIMMRFIEPNSKLDKKDIKMFIIAGLLGITLYFFFENTGIKRISASSASLIVAIIPILTIIADALVFKEQLTSKKVVSVLMSVIGVYFIVGSGGAGDSKSQELFGYMMMLAASISWVIYTLVTKSLFKKYSELAIVYYQTIFGTITLVPFAFFERTDWSQINITITLNLVFLGIFCSALATYFYVIGMDAVGISASSLMMNLVPVVAVAASFFILKERITLLQITGGLLITGAVCLCSFKANEKKINIST